MYSEQNIGCVPWNVLKANANVPECVREMTIIFPPKPTSTLEKGAKIIWENAVCSWVFSKGSWVPQAIASILSACRDLCLGTFPGLDEASPCAIVPVVLLKKKNQEPVITAWVPSWECSAEDHSARIGAGSLSCWERRPERGCPVVRDQEPCILTPAVDEPVCSLLPRGSDEAWLDWVHRLQTSRG